MRQDIKLELMVLGAGTVGRCWLQNFVPTLPPQVRVAAVANSRQFSWVQPGQEPLTRLLQGGQSYQLAEVEQWVRERSKAGVQVAVVDLTAAPEVSAQYRPWVHAGAHLISANKLAGSGPLTHYQDLQQALNTQQRHWLYNTTVGAGLPIQQLLRERLACGDLVHRLTGNLSGSLSWMLARLAGGGAFSYWLQEAARKGLTEPDPRADLSGADVARKVLILARELGWQLELADVELHSLLPDCLAPLSLEQFWYQSAELDRYLTPGQSLDYVAHLWRDEQGCARAWVGPQQVAEGSALRQQISGSTCFQITSDHYQDIPLVLQGPGAGPTVTAAGVMSDVLNLAQLLMRGTPGFARCTTAIFPATSGSPMAPVAAGY